LVISEAMSSMRESENNVEVMEWFGGKRQEGSKDKKNTQLELLPNTVSSRTLISDSKDLL